MLRDRMLIYNTRFPTKWALTKGHEELIKEFRETEVASLLLPREMDNGDIQTPENGFSLESCSPILGMEKENDAMDSDIESVKSASTKLPRPKTRSRSKKENALMDIN
jgi:hypothetical protein